MKKFNGAEDWFPSWKQKNKWNADDEITLRINALALSYDNLIYINT